MPYKDPERQKKCVNDYHKSHQQVYGTPYKRAYRQFQKERDRKAREELQKAVPDVAKAIFGKKPQIHIFENTWKNLLGAKDKKRRK